MRFSPTDTDLFYKLLLYFIGFGVRMRPVDSVGGSIVDLLLDRL